MMDNSKNIRTDKFSRLALFANCSHLSFLLAKKLLNNSFEVEVFTNQRKHWQEKIKQEKLSLEINNLKEAKTTSFDYAISLNVNSPGEEFNKKYLRKEKNVIVLAAEAAKKFSSKCIFVFSYQQKKDAYETLSSWVKEILNDKNLFAGVIYLGEVVSVEDPLIGNNGLSSVLKLYLKNSPVIISKDEKYFYPIRVEEVTDEIIRGLFSLRAYGTEVVIIPHPISAEEIISSLIKIRPELKFLFTDKLQGLITPPPQNFIYRDFNYMSFFLELTERYLEKELQIKKDIEERIEHPLLLEQKVTIKRHHDFLLKANNLIQYFLASFKQRKIVFVLITSLLIFLVFPWLLFAASLSCLSTANKSFEKGNVGLTEKSLLISEAASGLNVKYSLTLKKLPFLGTSYKSLADASVLMVNTSGVGLRVVSLTKNLIGLSNQIIDENSVYDPSNYSKKISLDLDLLYRDLGFLEGELNDSQNYPSELLRKLLDNINILDVREKILLLKKVSEELPSLLGQDKTVNYLILFQNNLHLAPTGGLIDAFGLLTFSDGKLTNSKVYSSDEVDKLLKGYVEPPEPLRKYFEKKAWYLKDSNWDPDFSISAAKAEWFIDKELDRSLDGVIGIDVEFIRAALMQTGNLTNENLGQKVTSINLYELIRENDQAFLTRVTQEFLAKILTVNSNQKIILFRETVKELDERHFQIFLHNTQAQRAFSDLHWTGEVYQPTCLENCYADFLAIIEAEADDSWQNTFLRREVNFEISFEKGLIKRKLTFFLDNSSQRNQVGKYKSYVRVLAPEDSSFEPVGIFDGQTKKNIDPEVYGLRGHKEAGVLVELLPGEAKALIISWESGLKIDFDNEGEYLFYLRKQAGLLDHPVEVKISFPENLKVIGTPSFNLTEGRFVGYNTVLSRDFISQILW